jgi:hypothetical protein
MFQVKMRYAGISEPYKLTRVYERDNKTKKTKSLQERSYMISHSYCIMAKLAAVMWIWALSSGFESNLSIKVDQRVSHLDFSKEHSTL